MKYIYNVDFFKTWSRDMAYILGFIEADGCISKNRRVLEISLNIKDRCILEYIAKHLGSNLTVKSITQFNKHKNKTYYKCRLDVYSKEMVGDLLRLGVTPQKTGKEKWPYPPKKYVYDYIRGYFDGDGCVSSKKHKPMQTQICCMNKKFLMHIKKVLGFGSIYRKLLKSNKYIYTLRTSYNDSILFRDLIYNHESFALPRKKEIFYRDIDLTCRRWNKKENELFIKIYPDMDKLQQVLKRSRETLIGKAIRLGLYTTDKDIIFKDEDEQFIKDNFNPKNPKSSISYIASKLNRSVSSIEHKVTRLGLRGLRNKWTQEQEDYIIQNRDKMSIKQIATNLNLSYSSTQNKISALGL